jgi:hypothetical protein
VKCRPRGNVFHPLPRQRREYLPAFVPEERPDQPEGRDNLIAILPLSRAIRGPFLFRFKLHRLAVPLDQDLPNRLAN